MVDSSLDLPGLGYFYFPESRGEEEEEEKRGGECACGGGGGSGRGGEEEDQNPSTNVRQRPVTAAARRYTLIKNKK